MMNPKIKEILDELKQLIAQYRAEVPGGRRAWPKAIKSRVNAVFSLGMGLAEIAEQTEISYHTIVNWIPAQNRRRYHRRVVQDSGRQLVTGGQFSELQVKPSPKAIATVIVKKAPKMLPSHSRPIAVGGHDHKNTTVTVTTADGIRIDGVTPEFLILWLGRGNSGGAR